MALPEVGRGGVAHAREVDDHWLASGAKLHHSVGSWPLLIDDDTEVLECQPPSRLVLQTRAWASGEARVTLRLESHTDATTVTIEEDVVSELHSVAW